MVTTLSTIAFWFRRDLRLEDNIGLQKALEQAQKVLAVFIFDDNITKELPADDPRINFIYESLQKLNNQFAELGGSILVRKGDPIEIWKDLISSNQLQAIYTNHDYEPYAIQRDQKVGKLCSNLNIHFQTFKDQVVFEKSEVVKADNKPYSIFTPYKIKWLQKLDSDFRYEAIKKPFFKRLLNPPVKFPLKQELGIIDSLVKVRPFNLDTISNYEQSRNNPAKDSGSYLGPHLRFGTMSIRKLVSVAMYENQTFLSELIWREFFMQIMFHYPSVAYKAFKSKYDHIEWINSEEQFDKWCIGETGYPMVDAGMRQLNQTGYLHNRVRMVTAGFLVKHLLIDWRWGEAYFASKLLDFEFSSNNGNWQWAAGTGCDAAPYFRVFNPLEQQKKFDPGFKYIKSWIDEFGTDKYPKPIVEHTFARKRAIETYKKALQPS